MKQDEIMLLYAELNSILHKATVDLEEFVLQNKITRGRDLRRHLRDMRQRCKETMDKSLDYERKLREAKSRKRKKCQ